MYIHIYSFGLITALRCVIFSANILVLEFVYSSWQSISKLIDDFMNHNQSFQLYILGCFWSQISNDQDADKLLISISPNISKQLSASSAQQQVGVGQRYLTKQTPPACHWRTLVCRSGRNFAVLKWFVSSPTLA